MDKVAKELLSVAKELTAAPIKKTYRGEYGDWFLEIALMAGDSHIDALRDYDRTVRKQAVKLVKDIDNELGYDYAAEASIVGCVVKSVKNKVAVVCSIFVEADAGDSMMEDFPDWLKKQGFKRG